VKNETLTSVPGIRVGHATDLRGATGCTVIVCPDGTVGGVDQRGGAPGTRETDLLRPMHLVSHVHAICLSGGSAFGLAAADGVMRWCEVRGNGFRTSAGHVVPIVPAAIVNDLGIGEPDARPDAAMGYAACEAASDAPVSEGSVGAGTGCRIAGGFGAALATKGGLGSFSIELGGGLVVAALAVVNAVGDVVGETGQIIAGLRSAGGNQRFANLLHALRDMRLRPQEGEATVIGVVASNARMTKEHVNKVAQMAHDGLARAIRPAHTMYDGDTIFGLATQQVEADVNLVGAYAAEAFERAIRRGVRAAESLHGVRAWND
jgi:L-aminopeptidase/D-esterase-like protein